MTRNRNYFSMMRIMLFLCLAVFFGSCFEKKSLPATSEVFLPPHRMAELTNKKLKEASGLAASTANPGLLWTHNDSGNPAIVYLIDENLEIRLECKLAGIKNRDWEDIAVGPGPDPEKRYVYVADIGDNDAKHAVKFIYRFEEPVESDLSEITISSFDTISFKLPDGSKDTETILIHPTTGNIYIVSKREMPVHVYELTYPFNTRDTLTADAIISLPLTQIVAGEFSPDGTEVVMKNYDNIYYWNTGGKPLTAALKTKPEILHYTKEPQGESLTFNPNGSGFYTLSEKIKGEKSYLYYYARKK
jgi:hypothetical protein